MLTVEKIRQTVAGYFKDKPVEKVWLFGSYARGDAREDCDVDLLFELRPGARVGIFALGGYQLDLSEHLGRKVDLAQPHLLYELVAPFVEKEKTLLLTQ